MEFKYGTPEYEEWMARADEAKEKFTQEAFDALPNLYRILNNKIGMNLTYDASMKKSAYGEERINIRSSDLSLDGWTKFLFRSVVLETFNSSVGVSTTDGEYNMSKEPKAYYWMTVNFEYEHTGGGSNGHDFATCWFEDGQWKVRFVDEDELVTSSRKAIKSAAYKTFDEVEIGDSLVTYNGDDAGKVSKKGPASKFKNYIGYDDLKYIADEDGEDIDRAFPECVVAEGSVWTYGSDGVQAIKSSCKVIKSDREDRFVVKIALQGPSGEWDNVGYADWETSIDYDNGIYGYDEDLEENVSPMTKEDAEDLADEIRKNSSVEDVKVSVVPYMEIKSSRKVIKSSLKEELEKQMKERHLKLNPDGDTPDLSAAVEYIEQNDDWYIGTDEQKARKWIRDTLENSDDLITSSMIKDKIQSSAIGEKLRKADKFSGGIEVDRAFNSDSFADFKRHLAKAVEKANQNGSRRFRDKWEDIVEFTEPELKYLFNGPDGYNLPTSTERTLSPEEKKQRKQWQDDFAYGESVYSIGYNED